VGMDLFDSFFWFFCFFVLGVWGFDLFGLSLQPLLEDWMEQ